MKKIFGSNSYKAVFLDVLWFGCSVVGCSVVWVFSSLGVQWFGCSVVWVFSGLGLTWLGVQWLGVQ